MLSLTDFYHRYIKYVKNIGRVLIQTRKFGSVQRNVEYYIFSYIKKTLFDLKGFFHLHKFIFVK